MAKYKKASERESIVQNDSYIHVEGWMVNKLNLKGNALMIYAIIHGFTNHKDPNIDKYKGSLRFLADWTNSSKQAVINTLKQLLELKYIEKNPIVVNGVNYVEYRSRMLYEVEQDSLTRSQKTWIESVNYVDHDIQNSGHNNIDNIPEVTKGVNKEGTKGSEDVSSKPEDTPSLSEIEEMKKQLHELQMQLKEQIEEKKQNQGQNLVEKTDKTKTPPFKEEKDDKVKGEKDEEQEEQGMTEEELNEFFDKFGFTPPTEETVEEKEEPTIQDEADAWFFVN